MNEPFIGIAIGLVIISFPLFVMALPASGGKLISRWNIVPGLFALGALIALFIGIV